MKLNLKSTLLSVLALVAFGMAWASLPSSSQPEPAPAPAPKAQLPTEELTIEPMNKSDFRLDHHKVYAIKHQAANATVFLRGQFDGNQFRKAALARYIRFINPVDKNGEGIIDKHAHLNWYLIEADPEPIRTVSFYNQFGLQKVKIGNPVALLAPADKIEDGSQFPERLDHYKVYEVISAEPVNRFVTLRDQFVSTENVAIVPKFFAVPVEKRHNNAYFPITNREDHAVYYVLEPKEIQQKRKTKDQFGLHEMVTRYCELLGVPSKKLAWEVSSLGEPPPPPQ